MNEIVESLNNFAKKVSNILGLEPKPKIGIMPPAGKMYFRHYRMIVDAETGKERLVRYIKGDLHPTPLPYGGRTVCTLIIDGERYIGVSNCSRDDTFDYFIGRAKAFERAVMEYSKRYGKLDRIIE